MIERRGIVRHNVLYLSPSLSGSRARALSAVISREMSYAKVIARWQHRVFWDVPADTGIRHSLRFSIKRWQVSRRGRWCSYSGMLRPGRKTVLYRRTYCIWGTFLPRLVMMIFPLYFHLEIRMQNKIAPRGFIIHLATFPSGQHPSGLLIPSRQNSSTWEII